MLQRHAARRPRTAAAIAATRAGDARPRALAPAVIRGRAPASAPVVRAVLRRGCRRSPSRTTPPTGSSERSKNAYSHWRQPFMRAQSPLSCASWRMPSSVATAPSTPPRAGSSDVRPDGVHRDHERGGEAPDQLRRRRVGRRRPDSRPRALGGLPAARAGCRPRPRRSAHAPTSSFSRSQAYAFSAVPMRSQSPGRSWLWVLMKRWSSSSRPGAFGRPPGSICSPIRRLSRSSTTDQHNAYAGQAACTAS